MYKMKFLLAISIIILSTIAVVIDAQEAEIKILRLGDKLPSFTLSVYGGGKFKSSETAGKNLMLIFPRGYAGKDYWCGVCMAQYAEMVDTEKEEGLSGKYNLEIAYVFPYDDKTMEKWFDEIPGYLEKLENYRNPKEPEKLNEKEKARMELVRKEHPKTILYKKGEVPKPFRILLDKEQLLSKGLGLFSTDWLGSKIEQNIPAVYIFNSKGILEFKYVAQNLYNDRPDPNYLIRFLAFLTGGKKSD